MDIGLPEIRELIDLLNQSDLTELALETGDVKLSLKKAAIAAGTPVAYAAAPQAAPPSAPQLAITYAESPPVPAQVSSGGPPAHAPAATPDRGNLYLVRAPMVGTFYRASSPDAPPFVEVGQTVEPGQTVCIIEAMKLMNEIEAEHGGRVAKICVGNGEAVEFGQVLFEIER
ncbi:MAG: acetyl-CoA carboxylase biotin carboxyl carrier protein [Candidatus Sericytochromatia bacterium]|nr:acetyl-CoA carboxylase biotin carboxyl carrier protein [Candidatus Tanganyikabacteria bacterium]